MSIETKSEVAKREEQILAFWKERDIFKKSLAKKAPNGEFIFYEGPPTANGRPGIHHLESRAFKDAIPRFRTMQGYHVRRKAGWDTHGLPVELEVEKELGIKNKKDIEAYGIAKFNAKCKESVMRYIGEWRQFSDRIGFWADYDDTYFTYSNDYIESVWNILKTAHTRDLLYKDYKVVPWCPRCGTVLSSHEVAQGYDETKDPSVYVKFALTSPVGSPSDSNRANEQEYLLIWTTTPWTLPGNVALAVATDVVYVKARTSTGTIWIAKDRLDAVVPGAAILAEAKGSELVGRAYEPLYPFLKDAAPGNQREAIEKAHKIYAADFVSTKDGTGIVHTAVMYGADDFELGTKIGLPKVHTVGEDGKFLPFVEQFAGKFVKTADADIIADLQSRGLLFKQEIIEHTYPFCWRCKTPLLYYARDSWYIRMSAIKHDLIRENGEIHWEPEHIREGRFGEWLRDLKDWAISRSRYWGTPLPIWECVKCKQFEVLGSIAELRGKAGGVPEDLHRPYIDECAYSCWSCGGEMRRVPEVLDVWFDSGAMPFAQDHYPFENRAWIDDTGYPADFICEAIDQTRGWFYTLHAVGGIMGRGKAFKNVICLGHVLDAKGKKMSKSVGNVVEPSAMVAKYGADALRYFMYTVNAPGDSKNFDERIVDEIVKKNIGRLANVLAFYQLYADPVRGVASNGADGTLRGTGSAHVLDRWILARLDELVQQATAGLEAYQLDVAARPIATFIDDLSVWYLRRSRERFKEEGSDKKAALATLRYVLYILACVMAPTMPFFAEHLFQAVRETNEEESVHLARWPHVQKQRFLARLLGSASDRALRDMAVARALVSRALEAREKAGIRIRQPLAVLSIPSSSKLPEEYLSIIADEVNVKEVVFTDASEIKLDTNITDALREEGFVREFVRAVQGARKDAGLHPRDAIKITYAASVDERLIVKYRDQILSATHGRELVRGTNAKVSVKKI